MRFIPLIKKKAEEHGLNASLIAAVIEIESNFNPWATRYEAHWKWFLHPIKYARLLMISEPTERISQMISWGCMQVMGTVARELGYEGHMPRLCIPEIGIEYGCLKLKECLNRYDGNLEKGLAAYNAGSVTKNGLAYAAKVMRAMDKYKKISTCS